MWQVRAKVGIKDYKHQLASCADDNRFHRQSDEGIFVQVPFQCPKSLKFSSHVWKAKRVLFQRGRMANMSKEPSEIVRKNGDVEHVINWEICDFGSPLFQSYLRKRVKVQ